MSNHWPGKYVIGLTGNIAVGKSVVRQMLQHLGAYTIDADGLAHQAMSPGAPAYKPVIDTFGQFILNPDNTINRKMLGNIVFSSPDALAKLEAITHPIIRQAINTLVGRAKQRVVVIEAIKLLEGDLAQMVDAVWVVDASPKTQYTRLIAKRKMSEEDAKKRLLSQNPQAEKLKQANIVIKNDGNVEETWKQVQTEWEKIAKLLSASTAAPLQPAPTPTPAAQPAVPAQSQAAAPTTPPEQPAPVQPVAGESTGVSVDSSGITIKRGMPSNAEAIANFITEQTGQPTGRMDVIMSFGQKSYLLAMDANGHLNGLVGWQVENLITRADELYVHPNSPKIAVVHAIISAIEEASMELQSEVSFIFLPGTAGQDMLQPFMTNGYEVTSVKEIKIPAWREAVQEVASDDTVILTKKLRKDRILKPI